MGKVKGSVILNAPRYMSGTARLIHVALPGAFPSAKIDIDEFGRALEAVGRRIMKDLKVLTHTKTEYGRNSCIKNS